MTNQKKIILTGSTGLLGKALLETIPPGYKIFPFYSKDLPQNRDYWYYRMDITKKGEVAKNFAKIKPDIVIHAASLGNVDYCEKNSKEAYLVNVTGTKNIVEMCEKYKCKLIFTSTNAVFDGQHAPYSETGKTHPINYYGKTKVLGENLVLQSNPNNVVVRMTLIYGWNNSNQRSNAVTWLLDRLRRAEPTKLVNDTFVNPLYNLQAAENIWKIIKTDKSGIFHLAGKTRVNRYQFGVAIAKAFGFDPKLLSPVSSDFFPGIAKRMPNTTFDTSKMVKELDSRPLSIKAGLEFMQLQSP